MLPLLTLVHLAYLSTVHSVFPENRKDLPHNNNDNNNKHAYGGQLNSVTYLRALLVHTPQPRHSSAQLISITGHSYATTFGISR
jgi:hypothetical protein